MSIILNTLHLEKDTHWVYYLIGGIDMNLIEMRHLLGETQAQFSKRYNIPIRTLQNWENGTRTAPSYLLNLLEKKVELDSINRKTITIPKFSQNKLNLPKKSEFLTSFEWVTAVQKFLGDNFVFALDEALICNNYFLGRDEEYIVWGYGDNSLTKKYNGVVIIGNFISPEYINKKNDVLFTNFNRTIQDALDNDSILDPQGIIEALSCYYFQNHETFNGIYVSPQYQKRFNDLAYDAIHYYDS